MHVYAMVQWLKARIALGERGASAVEYGMLVALIAAVVIGTVVTLGTQIQAAFQTIVNSLPAAP